MDTARIASKDPLAACLSAAARRLGEPRTRDALTDGLPLDDGRLTTQLIARAAERANLVASASEVPYEGLHRTRLPAILSTSEAGYCLLLSLNEREARVVFAGDEPAREATLPTGELRALYTGTAITLAHRPPVGGGSSGAEAHWFWGTLLRHWRLYGEVAMASLLVNVFGILSPLFFMNVYDRVVPHAAFDTLWVLAIGVCIVYAFDFLLKVLRGYFIDLAGRRADLTLSSRLYAQVMDIRLDQPRQSTGTLANNLKEFESLRDFFTSATLATVIDLPFVLVFLVAVLLIGGWPMLAVPAVAIPVVILIGVVVQAPLRDRVRRVFRVAEAKHAAIVETVGAIEQVKTLGAASELQRRWEAMTDFIAKQSQATRLLSAIALHASGFVQSAVSLATIVAGVYLIARNELTLGGLIACNIMATRAVAPLGQFTALLTRYHQAMSALEALNRIMAAPVDRPRDRRFVQRPAFSGEIQLRDVGFTYAGQETPALSRVSLTIRAGDRVGVIGRVGSGKSTLAKLIAGLYAPTEGSILYDGVEVRQIDPADTRRNIGYLPQNLVLFAGTVRDNLTLGARHVDDEAVLRAAQLAGLDEHVSRHPKGFDMPVGERGEGLSGGQRQAVALARSLVLDPPILVLDEPSHAIDRAGEERLKKRLAEEFAGRTIILVTHRESLLSAVDALVIVDRGRVVAHGPRDAVLKALADGKIPSAA